ncbi:MAG: hypothetical protein IIV53_07215 [Bacteroidaceae bacterium]|nr:hypothetical protein [Bacteroidaceae bacterium]
MFFVENRLIFTLLFLYNNRHFYSRIPIVSLDERKFSTAVGVVFLTLLCCPQKRCFIDENLIVLHICKILFKSAVFTFWYPCFLHGEGKFTPTPQRLFFWGWGCELPAVSCMDFFAKKMQKCKYYIVTIFS